MNRRVIRTIFLIIIIMLVCVGCTNKKNNKKKGNEVLHHTVFCRYSQSFCVGDNAIDLMLFTDDKDVGNWTIDNLDSAKIQIGYVVVPAEIQMLEIEDKLLYDKYHRGNMVVTADLQECSGDAFLCIKFKGEDEIVKYPLGSYGVSDYSNNSYDGIVQLVSGGVIKTDEEGNVFTYGVIVHCEIGKELTITKVDFGLDSAGLSTDKYVIYSPDEYKNNIRTSLDEVTFDQHVSNAYEKRFVSKINNEANILLGKGEYYLYFPVEYIDSESPVVSQATICISYMTSEGVEGSFVSNCNPFFMEYTKDEQVIDKMFSE